MKVDLKLETAAHTAIQAAIDCGVTDFCIAPGARASEFLALIKITPNLRLHIFYDERSMAFFALGKSQRTKRPVALIVTSGTALAYLMGAAMEAYYTGVPLLLITADRPRRFRGCNGPQACEQEHFFGVYTPTFHDLAGDESLDLADWDQRAPAHINVCLEEPNNKDFQNTPFEFPLSIYQATPLPYASSMGDQLTDFFEKSRHPFVVVSALKPKDRDSVVQFLLKLQAPLYLEATSGLREDLRLKPLQVTRSAAPQGYALDGVVRIGGVPTFRFWRDLEESNAAWPVFSINDRPFSGLSWGHIQCCDVSEFFQNYTPPTLTQDQNWKKIDDEFQAKQLSLYHEEPHAEASLIHALSTHIPINAFIFLGNSLPIREWDQAATFTSRGLQILASRGLSGIDGQTSTFFGAADPQQENWCILGDLTTLHDLSAPWILRQMETMRLNIVVINNGGGRIFARILKDEENQNLHHLSFKPFAELWGMHYERWETVPPYSPSTKPRLIEIVPDYAATQRYWERQKLL